MLQWGRCIGAAECVDGGMLSSIMNMPQHLRHMGSFRVRAVVLLAELIIGCASTASQPLAAPQEQRAYIARSCAALKERTSRAAPAWIFLEVADITEPIAEPIKEWLAVHPVQTHHLAGLAVPMTANTPVRGPYGICLDNTCERHEDGILDVVATALPTEASAAVELQLDFTFGNGQPRRLLVKTTNQEPVLASLTTQPKQTLVITPYYLFEPRYHSAELLAQCMSRLQ